MPALFLIRQTDMAGRSGIDVCPVEDSDRSNMERRCPYKIRKREISSKQIYLRRSYSVNWFLLKSKMPSPRILLSALDIALRSTER